jgi:uncharacterized membrane protein
MQFAFFFIALVTVFLFPLQVPLDICHTDTLIYFFPSSIISFFFVVIVVVANKPNKYKQTAKKKREQKKKKKKKQHNIRHTNMFALANIIAILYYPCFINTYLL